MRTPLAIAFAVLSSGCLLDRSGFQFGCANAGQCPASTTCIDGLCRVADAGTAGRPDSGRVGSGDGALDAGTPLVRFDDVTCDRETEASWEVAPGRLEWWAARTPRVLPGGGLAVEGERTNRVRASEDLATWTTQTQIRVVGTEAAPDGELDALVIEFMASRSEVGVGIATDLPGEADRYVHSHYARGDAPTAWYATLFDNAGVGYPRQRAPGTSWRRESHVESTRSWATAIDLGPRGYGVADLAGGTSSLWGVQVERGAFASSYIRTAGQRRTRAADRCDLAEAPERMRTGRWSVRIAPLATPEAARSSAPQTLLAVSPADRLVLEGDRVVLIDDGQEHVRTDPISWLAGGSFEVEVDAARGEVSVRGAATGDGIYSGREWAWSAGALRLGYGDGLEDDFFGVIDPPR